MTINLTGTVLASILFEHSDSICDKEGLVFGKVSNIVTDTISDSSLNNVKHQTVYHVHSFLHCEKLFSWYNSQGEVKADALKEILARYNSEDVIGWYKLRHNSSLLPSIREMPIHQHLEEWMKKRNANRKLLFFLCVSNSTHNGALYTTDHQFMTLDGRKFQNMAINIMNLGNISKPNYQNTPNFTCSTDSAYDLVVNRLRSGFVNGMNELGSLKNVNAMKSDLHDQLKKICAKLIRSEAELEKETAEVKRLRLQLESIEGHGNKDRNVDSTLKHNSELMEFEDDDKPLMVFDDDDDDLGVVNQKKECIVSEGTDSRAAAVVSHTHLLDENSEALDAIRLLDDNGCDSETIAIKRQKQGASKKKDPFEYVADVFDSHSAAASSSSASSGYGLRSQMNASPEPDLRGGIGRTARRNRGPRVCKPESDVTSNSAATGERMRKKIIERDEN